MHFIFFYYIFIFHYFNFNLCCIMKAIRIIIIDNLALFYYCDYIMKNLNLYCVWCVRTYTSTIMYNNISFLVFFLLFIFVCWRSSVLTYLIQMMHKNKGGEYFIHVCIDAQSQYIGKWVRLCICTLVWVVHYSWQVGNFKN